MLAWLKTAQGLAAIVAAIVATMLAWWNLGLPRLVFDVTPGDSCELIARQTSASTKNLAADEITWFAIEVLE
jgi:hypothetical protein